jgi:ferredoxin
MTGDPRIELDRDLCIGAEACVRAAPGAFVLDRDGTAEVLEPAEATDAELRRAALNCPSGAIRLVDR